MTLNPVHSMRPPDLRFVDVARALESEAVEGGRPLNEFSLAPLDPEGTEEQTVLGRPVDDAEETTERIEAVARYVGYAGTAFRERGLVYPFRASSRGDSLEVLPEYRDLAHLCAELSRMVSSGGSIAKEFETRAFRALHSHVSGWAIQVGSPRVGGDGPGTAVKRFRAKLSSNEFGSYSRAQYPPSGDLGADGFLVMGRAWRGPVLYFQAKNTFFDFQDYPPEFARIPSVLEDWFGSKLSQTRHVVPVLALNSVLTSGSKDEAFVCRGDSGVHILDAVDILCAEKIGSDIEMRRAECVEL